MECLNLKDKAVSEVDTVRNVHLVCATRKPEVILVMLRYFRKLFTETMSGNKAL